MPFRRLSLTRVYAVLLAAGALVPAGSGASAARTRHHRHGSGHAHPLLRPPPPPAAPVATPGPATHEFYPENVEGGVPGNLPFNNQIRKFTDPLNANGGR